MSTTDEAPRPERVLRVVHLTSVHDITHDSRILNRECVTLAKAGHEVHLVAPGGRSREEQGVHIHAVERPTRRADRLTRTAFRVAAESRRIGGDVYHVHDPELLPELSTFWRRARLVYDVHEDMPADILTKEWMPQRTRAAIAWSTGRVERLAARFLDLIVAATPTIASHFPPERTVLVQNFPSLADLGEPEDTPHREREPLAVYLGDVTVLRGFREMLASVAALDPIDPTRLIIAGRMTPPTLAASDLVARVGNRVSIVGWQDRASVRALLARARIGLCLFHPTQSHLLAQPTKLFEYMAAGIAVVASDFPAWRRFVTDTGSGILVDPLDPAAVSSVLRTLMADPARTEAMGRRGRTAVIERFNWAREGANLVEAYDRFR